MVLMTQLPLVLLNLKVHTKLVYVPYGILKDVQLGRLGIGACEMCTLRLTIWHITILMRSKRLITHHTFYSILQFKKLSRRGLYTPGITDHIL